MKNPMLQVGHTFADANAFRRVVKQANILKGKDLDFPRNETKKKLLLIAKTRSAGIGCMGGL
jgi:hypothetical protein